jgi:hypothetical protein
MLTLPINQLVACSVILLLACGGCTVPKIESQNPSKSSSCCEKPTFWLSFFPESDSDHPISIWEERGIAMIRIGWDAPEKTISHAKTFHSLKTLIISSKEWRDRASKSDHSARAWTGNQRDILSIGTADLSAVFQGDRVPAEWKRRIQALAAQEPNWSAERVVRPGTSCPASNEVPPSVLFH